LIDLTAALVTLDKILDLFLLFPEIVSQKPDNLLTGMVFGEVINSDDEMYHPVFPYGQIFLRFPDVLMVVHYSFLAHAASSINH
jgi:hypothetical protein